MFQLGDFFEEFVSLGGLSGGYISTIDLSKHSLIIPMESSFYCHVCVLY